MNRVLQLYHVEYNSGIIEGRFFADGSYFTWAQAKANDTRKPVKVCSVGVPLSPESIASILNDETDDLVWGPQETIYPEAV